MKDDITITAITLPEVVTVVFVIIKLCGLITWSWWWVLSPIWICWGAVLAVVFVIGILNGGIYLVRKIIRKRKNARKNVLL